MCVEVLVIEVESPMKWALLVTNLIGFNCRNAIYELHYIQYHICI